MARIALLTAFALACSAEPGPPGRDGATGPQGPPGPAGAQGLPGQDASGLGTITRMVTCGDLGETTQGESLAAGMGLTFFSSGWTYCTASLVTDPDDYAQSAWNPPGVDPVFGFNGLPLLQGLIIATMRLDVGQMVWEQDGGPVMEIGWGSDACDHWP